MNPFTKATFEHLIDNRARRAVAAQLHKVHKPEMSKLKEQVAHLVAWFKPKR